MRLNVFWVIRHRTLIGRLVPTAVIAGVLGLSLLVPAQGLPNARLAASCGAIGYGIGYGPSPVVTNVAPRFGGTVGGTNVTITGAGFCNNTVQVFFGSTAAASWVLDSDSQIRATSPAHAAGVVDVTVQTGGGTSPTSSADHFTFITDTPGVYTPRNPLRLLDTRSNGGRLGPHGQLTLQIGGVSVPANATAVILNVTATNTTAASFFTIFPTGSSVPNASNLNWLAGKTVPNLVSVKLGSNGSVNIFNNAGSADAIVDLEGYFSPPASGAGSDGQFVPLHPARITDTRNGSGQPNSGSHLGPHGVLNVQVTGVGGVPPTGAEAAVLNVTVVNTTANSFLTVWPTGSSLPNASNLNWKVGQVVPNRVIVPIGSGGKVSVYNNAGKTDVIIDVNGYVTDGTLSGSVFSSLSPSRILDTRTSIGGHPSKLGQGQTMVLHVAGQGGVPSMSASTPPTAVILNVTVTNATQPSFLTLFPDATSRPNSSDLNFIPGVTVANLVVVELGSSGDVDIYNNFGSTNVVVDVEGWFG